MIKNQIDVDDIWQLDFLLMLPLLKWEEGENLIIGSGKIVEQNRMSLYRWKGMLSECIKSIQPGKRKQPGILLIVAGLFYRQLEKEYCPLAKRYLVKVLEGMEIHYNPDCPYLRGGLMIFEARGIKPSNHALELESQLPYRSRYF